MAKVITTELQHSGASGANITLDSSKNVTAENNLTVDGTLTVTGTTTLNGTVVGDNAGAGKASNLIINGAMKIYTRGAATTTHNSFAADRFKYSTSGCDENPTLERIALTSSDTGPWEKGFRFANQFTNGNQTSGAGVGDYIRVMQRIEGQNIAQSGWDYTSSSSYITLSFWVKSSIAQNFYGYIYTADGTAQSYPFETGSLSANTWTKITKTIPGNSNITMDSDTGEGLRVTFVPFYGTNLTASPTLNTWGAYSATSVIPDMTSTWYTTNDATFAITGVQLEVGTGTEFEHRSYADELLRCQRYCRVYGGHAAYQRIGIGYFSSNDRIECPLPHAPKMRTTPTMTVSSAGHWKAESPSGSGEFTAVGLDGNSSPQVAIVWGDKSGTFTGGESGRYLADNTTDARIYLSAEL